MILVKAGSAILDSEGYGLEFRKTARETNGELLEMEAYYRPEGEMPPPHYHPNQEEYFKVVRGQFRVQLGSQIRLYDPGDEFIVTKGSSHAMQNVSKEKGHLVWKTSPALNSEDFFEKVWTLEQKKPHGKRGLDDILRLAVIFQEHRDEVRLTSKVQRILLRLIAPLGRARLRKQLVHG
jgi:quercetin dioxygenase-like cupin family protein